MVADPATACKFHLTIVCEADLCPGNSRPQMALSDSFGVSVWLFSCGFQDCVRNVVFEELVDAWH